MIKCNVKVCGTVVGKASMVTPKNGGDRFISFNMAVDIPDKNGVHKQLDVSIGIDGCDADLQKYQEGMRLEVIGNLTVRKKENVMYFNLRATAAGVSEGNDEITGTVTFRGTVGKTVDERKDKKGRDYYNFSAFTTEKNGETYSFIWLRFVHFGAKREDWLQPGIGVDAQGELEISTYNGTVYLGCRLAELKFWDKAAMQNSQPNVGDDDSSSVLPF